MNEPVKKQLLLAALLDAWIRHPHQRLGQLIFNTVAPSKSCPELLYLTQQRSI